MIVSDLPLIARAKAHGPRAAIQDPNGTHAYSDLLSASARAAGALLGGRGDLQEARVAFLTPPDFSYAAVQWGIWRAGGIAVPLAISHPAGEWEYTLRDSGASGVVAGPSLAEAVREPAGRAGVSLLSTVAVLGAPPAPLPRVP